MSKYEQISNWNKRPLRKSQIHYGAFDAYILLKIYEEMKVLIAQTGEDIERYIDSSIGGVIVGSKNSKQHELEDEKIELEEIIKEKQFEEYEYPEEGKEETSKKSEAKKKPYRPKKNGEKKIQEKKEPSVSEKKEVKQFYADEKYANFYSDSDNLKFLVDNMAMKLSKYMRNIGLDAEYLSVKNHDELTQLAKDEKRIIVTRDAKYIARNTGVPTFFLQKQKTAEQLKELIDYFKLKVKEYNFLSRCVKCNHTGLIVLSAEEAKKYLQWKNDDDYALYDTFWQCEKCKQIYWEGHTFKKAQVRFKEFAPSGEDSSSEDAFEETKNTEGLDTELANFDFE